jgi:hypothetical protein
MGRLSALYAILHRCIWWQDHVCSMLAERAKVVLGRTCGGTGRPVALRALCVTASGFESRRVHESTEELMIESDALTCEHTWQKLSVTVDTGTFDLVVCTKCKIGKDVDGNTVTTQYFWSKKATIEFE